MYSHIKAVDGSQKGSICICRNRGGGIEGLSDVYVATGMVGGRTLNVAEYWGSFDTESRSNDSLGIDGGRQNEEEYGSGEGLGEHLDKQ